MTRKQRVSEDGKWVYMADGSRFKRTVLPSIATRKEQHKTTDIKEVEAMLDADDDDNTES